MENTQNKKQCRCGGNKSVELVKDPNATCSCGKKKLSEKKEESCGCGCGCS